MKYTNLMHHACSNRTIVLQKNQFSNFMCHALLCIMNSRILDGRTMDMLFLQLFLFVKCVLQ